MSPYEVDMADMLENSCHFIHPACTEQNVHTSRFFWMSSIHSLQLLQLFYLLTVSVCCFMLNMKRTVSLPLTKQLPAAAQNDADNEQQDVKILSKVERKLQSWEIILRGYLPFSYCLVQAYSIIFLEVPDVSLLEQPV